MKNLTESINSQYDEAGEKFDLESGHFIIQSEEKKRLKKAYVNWDAIVYQKTKQKNRPKMESIMLRPHIGKPN